MKQLVHIIDDDIEITEIIKQLLNSVAIENQSHTSAENFLTTYKPETTSCIILDIRMHGISGLQLQKILKERGNNIPIIFITGHGDIPMIRQAMKDGAIDFLTKPFNNQELLDIVQKTLRQSAAHQQKQKQQQLVAARYASLTKREREIMQEVINGKSNKTIANNLNLSISTIEAHRARVMCKMEVNSLAELIKTALLYIQH